MQQLKQARLHVAECSIERQFKVNMLQHASFSSIQCPMPMPVPPLTFRPTSGCITNFIYQHFLIVLDTLGHLSFEVYTCCPQPKQVLHFPYMLYWYYWAWNSTVMQRCTLNHIHCTCTSMLGKIQVTCTNAN